MKIAVTGVFGFVGRHLVKELIRRSCDVVAIVRRIPADMADFPEVHVVQMSLEDVTPQTYDQLGRPDALVDLAWGELTNYSSSLHFERELPIHHHFIKTLVGSGLAKVMVTGTCFEYGMVSGAVTEATAPNPINPYGYAKHALFQQLNFIKDELPFALIWARLFYMYGEGQSERSLYQLLRRAVMNGESHFNMSGGEQLRDYLSVIDVAKYLASCVCSGGDIGALNICSGEPVSVRRLVERWIKDNNWSIHLNIGAQPYSPHEPFAFWGDRTKLMQTLGAL